MALQIAILAGIGYGLYALFNDSNKLGKLYTDSITPTPITTSAFVGYDDDVNNNRDPLMVKFNSPHLPEKRSEPGPYGVPREIRSSQYGESEIPYFGKNVTKI